MLDDFVGDQRIAYNFLNRIVKSNKLSHAYIVETNGYQNSWNFVKSMAKYFLCPKKYSNLSKCDNCSQCLKIDKDEFTELKIIDASGQWIKKSQLDELQVEFSKKSIIGSKKVYIIKDAEKLNVSSSNSLLKFLEEPEDGIIAILMVENRYLLLDTIVSRCQIISLNKADNLLDKSTLEKIANILFDSKYEIKEYLENLDSVVFFEKVLNFVEFYEANKLDTLIYLNKMWHDAFKERDDMYKALYIMIVIYTDILNYELFENIEIFNDYEDRIVSLSKNIDVDNIIQKINKIMTIRDKMKYNINMNLAMDKLIINLEEVNNFD